MIHRSTDPVVLLGGAPVTQGELSAAIARAPGLVCADGGADTALEAGLAPDAVIGDFDSISPQARAAIAAERLHPIAEQDSTDFDKCLRNVDAPWTLGLGFLGGRMDHALAAMTSLVRHAGAPCLLLGGGDVVLAAPAERELALDLPEGSRLSLYPLAPVRGQSRGLCWPIDGIDMAPAERIGTSNRVTGPVRLRFEARGMLIILPAAALDAALAGLGLVPPPAG